MSYPYGSTFRLSATFTNASGKADDPTTVIVSVKAPGRSGATTTKTYPTDAEVVRDGTGAYHYDVTMSEGGTWTYRFEGTGAVKAASPDRIIDIDNSVFAT